MRVITMSQSYDVRSLKSLHHFIAVCAKSVSLPELFGLKDRSLIVTVASLTNHANSLLNCDVTGGNGSFQQRQTTSC